MLKNKYRDTALLEGKNKNLKLHLSVSDNSKNIKLIIKEIKKYGVSADALTNFIIETKNNDFIKECVNEREKLVLGSYCITKMIISTQDVLYIKKCIENREELRLASFHISKLIKATKDIKYIKECIKQNSRYKMDSIYITELILSTKDNDYIKKCVEDSRSFGLCSYIVTNIIKFSNDVEYIKKCIDNWQLLGLNANDIVELIKNTKDEEFIKKCIENAKYYKLSSSELANLMIYSSDLKSIKEYIQRRNNYKLTSSDLLKMIVTTNNEEFIKGYIKNKLTFDNDDMKALIISTNNPEFIESNLSYLQGCTEINLPESITFGIEIECVGLYADKIKGLLVGNSGVWNVKTDDTVTSEISGESQIEIISPVLGGSNYNTTKEIRMITFLLDKLGQHVNNSCGGHVHIGSDYLKTPKAYLIFLEIYGNCEYIIYLIVNEEGSIPRGIEYASPISKKLEDEINNKRLKINSKLSINNLKETLIEFQGTRGKALNFMNLDSKKSGTFEFRGPNGTINPDIWIDNINLFGSIIRVSQHLAKIIEKDNSQQTFEEKRKLKIFEKLKKGIDDYEKLELLLDLLFENNSVKNSYKNRYIKNDKLLKEDNHFYELIKSKVVVDKIIIEKDI